jgi:hypothetical protein
VFNPRKGHHLSAVVFTRHQLEHAVGQRRIAAIQQHPLHETAREALVLLRLGGQRIKRLDVGAAPCLRDLARLVGLLLVLDAGDRFLQKHQLLGLRHLGEQRHLAIGRFQLDDFLVGRVRLLGQVGIDRQRSIVALGRELAHRQQAGQQPGPHRRHRFRLDVVLLEQAVQALAPCRRQRWPHRPELAHHPMLLHRARLWLFDLDNTLHDASHAIFPAISANMNTYIARVLGDGVTPASQEAWSTPRGSATGSATAPPCSA